MAPLRVMRSSLRPALSRFGCVTYQVSRGKTWDVPSLLLTTLAQLREFFAECNPVREGVVRFRVAEEPGVVAREEGGRSAAVERAGDVGWFEVANVEYAVEIGAYARAGGVEHGGLRFGNADLVGEDADLEVLRETMRFEELIERGAGADAGIGDETDGAAFGGGTDGLECAFDGFGRELKDGGGEDFVEVVCVGYVEFVAERFFEHAKGVAGSEGSLFVDVGVQKPLHGVGHGGIRLFIRKTGDGGNGRDSRAMAFFPSGVAEKGTPEIKGDCANGHGWILADVAARASSRRETSRCRGKWYHCGFGSE